MTILKPVGKGVKLFKTPKFKTALRREGKGMNTLVKGRMLAPTRTWSERPNVKTRIMFEPDIFRAISSTSQKKYSQKKYIWTSKGTDPHIIRPRRKPILKFRTGFRPKTLPGRLTASRGGASGPWVSAKIVRHPGTRPRGFTETIARWATNNNIWSTRVLRAIREAKV